MFQLTHLVSDIMGLYTQTLWVQCPLSTLCNGRYVSSSPFTPRNTCEEFMLASGQLLFAKLYLFGLYWTPCLKVLVDLSKQSGMKITYELILQPKPTPSFPSHSYRCVHIHIHTCIHTHTLQLTSTNKSITIH